MRWIIKGQTIAAGDLSDMYAPESPDAMKTLARYWFEILELRSDEAGG
jgi:hypothetical protein